jgi:hypothetical protein
MPGGGLKLKTALARAPRITTVVESARRKSQRKYSEDS